MRWHDLQNADISIVEGICYVIIFTSIMSVYVLLS
jgi:hypothetical protein